MSDDPEAPTPAPGPAQVPTINSEYDRISLSRDTELAITFEGKTQE